MRTQVCQALRALSLSVLSLCIAHGAAAQTDQIQLNDNCTISVLNRNVRVRPDGSWVLPNIPANFGQVRARVTCVVDGQTVSGESEPFLIPANGVVNRPRITFGQTTAIPRSVTVTTPVSTLTAIGATAQLTVTARYADGSTKDVTSSAGTQYTISNQTIATVSTGGLVQAVTPGVVVIQATLEGASGITSIRIASAGGDTDGDGMPDEYEVANGLNPNNPTDALEDPDHDGLTNLQEYQLGTDPRNPDTDGDRLSDGQEVQRGTNPLAWDSDGDGISDGLEVAVGTNPLDGSSFNLGAVLSEIRITPANFVLSYNTIAGEASTRLAVSGTMLDGRTLDITARGVNFASSDLSVCNFGGTAGQVFAGQAGPCTITASIAALSAAAVGTVRTFSPTALGFIDIPGYANNVDANGSFAYVAAGSAGLVVVDTTEPSLPKIVGSLAPSPSGNANDVRVVGDLAYIASGAAGLEIIDVSDPAHPLRRSTIDTPGDASDVIVSGSLAFVADGSAGLQIIDVSNPAAPLLVKTVVMPGLATGVDVTGTIAVVTNSFPRPSLQVVDFSNLATARIVGSVTINGEPIDVSIGKGYAYVAAYTGGVSIVDVRQPTAPVVVGGLPGTANQIPAEGFVPRDVQTAGQFALFAEQLFATAVAPIVDVSNPSTPRFRAVLDFGQDYAGTGIAVSGPYVYWTGQSFFVGSENGVSGSTRLFIGQYMLREDLNGIPPTVSITSPDAGTQFIEGSSVTVRVNATDDVAVAQVTFTVNGDTAFVDTSEPYQYTFKVPVGASTVFLGATATDLGGNTGTAPTVAISVIPDPLTTVVGRVIGRDLQPLAGVNVTVLGHSATTAIDGTFSIASVPTLPAALIVSASLSVNGTILTGSSAAAAPVRGGTTDVGDIVAAATIFENDLGRLVDRCTFCDVTVPLPFGFTIGGVTYNQIAIGNGYLQTDRGDRLSAFCCNLSTEPGGGGGGESLAAALAGRAVAAAESPTGLYVNDQLPGRFVVTWNRHFTFYTGEDLNTIQIVLFSDGRIQYGYRGVSADATADVGLRPAARTTQTNVDFSTISSLTVGPTEEVVESFAPWGTRFDLDGGFIVFSPAENGGYEIRPVPDIVAPTCAIVSPANGATLFEGEQISVEATATDNGAVNHVTFTSSDGTLNFRAESAPFTAPFSVPVGITQLTFTATAFDGWRNSGACSATVSVTPGPPPVVAIGSLPDGTTLTAGATIPIAIDIPPARVPVASVDLIVNGVTVARDPAAPYEFRFTVPAGVNALSFSAAATDNAGHVGTSPAASASVVPDRRTTLQGRLVDRSAAPVGGADVAVDLHGASVEVFDFDTALDALPDLTGRTPNRTMIASAINLRNPDGIFGANPFAFGTSVSHAARLSATLQTTGASRYTFRLGVNAGGQLLVNGDTVIDIPAGNGQFQDGTADVDVNAGSVAIEIRMFDNGNPEVQLSVSASADGPAPEFAAAAAPATTEEVVAPDQLTPAVVLYHATSQGDGTFTIADLPTILGDVAVRASATVDGKRAHGASAATATVPDGVTDLGDIVMHSGGIVGYYDLDFDEGIDDQVPPILAAELQAVNIGRLATADLSQIDVLFMNNPDNDGYSPAFLNNLPKIHQFVANGGVLVFHDRHVAMDGGAAGITAADVLPGTAGVFVRAFTDDRNIEIVDDTTEVTNGPGGRLNNQSLDGGNSSSHGWVEAASIPAGARGILSQGDPRHLVLYSYAFGLGRVVYSTIPLDYYLNGGDPVSINMQHYAANVLLYANDLK